MKRVARKLTDSNASILASIAGYLATLRSLLSMNRSYVNDFYRAFGVTSDRFRVTSQQEALDTPMPMGTNYNEVGVPLGCCFEYAVSHITYLDSCVCVFNPTLRKSSAARSTNA